MNSTPQLPVSGLQNPARQESSNWLQSRGVPTHSPVWHISPSMHGFPLSHGTASSTVTSH